MFPIFYFFKRKSFFFFSIKIQRKNGFSTFPLQKIIFFSVFVSRKFRLKLRFREYWLVWAFPHTRAVGACRVFELIYLDFALCRLKLPCKIIGRNSIFFLIYFVFRTVQIFHVCAHNKCLITHANGCLCAVRFSVDVRNVCINGIRKSRL